MAFLNLVKVNTATAGTGTVTLGTAVSGFLTPTQAGAVDGATYSYGIVDGTNTETGTGTYTAAGTTLTRSVINSTNSNALLTLSGTAIVYITPNTADLNALAPKASPTLTGTTSTATLTVSSTLAVAGATPANYEGAAITGGLGLLLGASGNPTFKLYGGATNTETIQLGRSGSNTWGLSANNGSGLLNMTNMVVNVPNGIYLGSINNFMSSALLQFTAGSTSFAPMRLTTSGAALLTSPVSGVIETDGTSLFWTTGAAARYALASTNTFTSSTAGLVPASGGGTTTFLRADGTFAAPAGGGGGTGFIVSATGTGSSQGITIPTTVTADSDVYVFINGILQRPTTDYTISGTTLTITTNSSGDVIYISKPAGSTGATGAPGPSGSAPTVVTKSATYTEATTTGEIVILADLVAGFTITLPTAVSNTAKFTIKKMQSAGAIVVNTTSSQTIDGGLTATLAAQYSAITLVSNNSNWVII